MFRQETPKTSDEGFYYITSDEYGRGYVIRCDDWDQSEWRDSEGYNYFTEEYGDVVFYWDEDMGGFYVSPDDLSCGENAVIFMNDQHERYMYRLPADGYWALEKIKRGYLIIGYNFSPDRVRLNTHMIKLAPDTYATWDEELGGWIVSRRDYEIAKEWVDTMNYHE